MPDTKERDLQEIGRNAYESIADMVAALECDYDRLAELREERGHAVGALVGKADNPTQTWAEANPDDATELAELEAAAGGCESREDAEQRIQEDPLSIEVRSGWTTQGFPLEVAEFNILLATGGPAVRIVGELDRGEPSRAWLEVQDWFTPWTQYVGASQDVLLTYARCFYFGE
jgi:hypothetical protein